MAGLASYIMFPLPHWLAIKLEDSFYFVKDNEKARNFERYMMKMFITT